MDDFQRLQRQSFVLFSLSHFLSAGIGVAVWYFTKKEINSELGALGLALLVAVLTQLIITSILNSIIMKPLGTLWQVILYVSSNSKSLSAPELKRTQFGRELISSLANRIYQFAGTVSSSNSNEAEHRKSLLQSINIVKLFPHPLFVFNKEQIITSTSQIALDYVGIESNQLLGHKLFEVLDLNFTSSDTLENWVNDCQANKVTDYKYWYRVQLKLLGERPVKQCDISAYYNRDSPSGTEFIVTIIDRTNEYSQADDSLGFIALAVHELRTPLTMLYGYIEVFEEELSGKLDDELTGYLRKLRMSADQLSTFVTNVLNVTKIDNNQLSLRLFEIDYSNLIKQSTASLVLRAQMLGKRITFNIEDGLPTVAADPTSIGEVINNILDNAIKYSEESNEIVISAKLNPEGMVETTIQDFGVGIPANIIPNIFDRFYRNHRTRGQFSGTGLGLYLAKVIITAHGGNIWVKSKPGEGSIFSFTLQLYSNLADELKSSDNKEIIRQAHGWIKNHSMYRR